MPDSKLIAFYKGGRDDRGRTLEQIRIASDTWLEVTHDYIQWVFPLPEPSAFNPGAPLLTAADIAAFGQEAALRERLAQITRRMLQFYGFVADGVGEGDVAPRVQPAANFDQRAAQWIAPGNHNFLRLSRILRSLSLLGHHPFARTILVALDEVASGSKGGPIGATTLRYWRQAAETNYI